MCIFSSPIFTPKEDSRILLSKSFKNNAKRRGLSKHPCLTPREQEKRSVRSLSPRTQDLTLLYKDDIILNQRDQQNQRLC